uniref:Uncharacterized protein n=1 Tax=Anguilla anguilla TaxID=7936 RepID=A0A0E9UFU6_ANGAN
MEFKLKHSRIYSEMMDTSSSLPILRLYCFISVALVAQDSM